MMKKIISIVVSGLWLLAGVTCLPAVVGAQTTANTKATSQMTIQPELYVVPIPVQEVGGREAYDAVQNGAVQLDTEVRVDSHAEVISETADRQTPKRDFGDRLRFNFIWDSQADLDPVDERALEALKKNAEFFVQGDPNIRKIEVSNEEVTIRYSRPAKLFGFIPVAYSHAFTLDGKGQISHGRPWWLIFASDDAVDFELGVEAAFQHNQSNLDFLKLQNIIDRQDQILQTLSNILKTRHDVSMSVIRNMK